MDFKGFKTLSDKDLVTTLETAIVRERSSVAASIHLLGEMVRRDLHTRLGYSSVYALLTQRFRLSESCASKRAAAVAATRRYPEILGMVERGALNLSNLSLISRKIDDTNKDRLVAAACRMTHRELEEFLARDVGVPLVRREIVRAVPVVIHQAATKPVGVTEIATETTFRGNEQASHVAGLFTDRATVSNAPTDVLSTPSTPSIDVGLRLSVTLEGDAKAALDELRRLFPGKSVTDILAEALVAQRNRVTPAARAAAPKRVAAKRSSASRYIPKAVRHEVFTRDGGRCTYVAPDGRRCDGTVGIEYDHVRPIARGGASTAGNLRILCKAHNLQVAKDMMGKAFIESHYRRPTETSAL